MAFNRAGFTAAAKAMGYNDDEINQIATIKEAQSTSPTVDDQLKQTQLGTAKYNLAQEQIKTQQLQQDPYGIKAQQAKDEQKIKLDQMKKIATDASFNKGVKDLSKSVLDVINNRQKYASEDEYNSAINLAASQMAAKVGFGIGGKVLSEGEKALLQPQMPNFAKSKTVQKGSLPERAFGFLTGSAVPQTEITQEKLADTPEKLRQKMQLWIDQYGSDEEKKAYLTPKDSQVQKPSTGTALPSISLGGLASNAGKDLYDIVNGVLNIPAVAKQGIIDRIKKGQMIDPQSLAGAAGETMIKGIINEYNQALGEPLKGGDILGRIGQRAYEKPVSTALDVLPFIKLGKAGAAGKAVEGAEVATETVKPNVLQNIGKDIKGRVATGIGVVDPSDVARSEQLMGDALKMTKSFTKRGISKELGEFVPKAGEAIDDWAKVNDAKIGMQPLGEIITPIKERLSQTVVGQANPQLVDLVAQKLEKNLNIGKLPGGIEAGEPFGTTVTKLNQTRKLLNSSIPDKWFESKPTVSATDNLSHLNWEASKALKDVIGELDDTGKIKQLINQQHVALETKPVLAQMALQKGGISSSWWRTLMNALGGVTEPVQVAGSRLLQGKATPIQLPSIESVGAAPSATLDTSGFVRKPLEQSISQQIIKGKGPAQAVRYAQDTGMPDIKTRSAQEAAMRQAIKKKYK